VLATTGYKAVLLYLYRREAERGRESLEVDALLDELRRLDGELGGAYGFSSLGDAYSFSAEITLAFLEETGYARYFPQNPHVELTELGRGFASLLNFPDPVEQQLPDFLKRL